MVELSNSERDELLRLAGSVELRRDMRYLRDNRISPLQAEGEDRLDRLVEFLSQYNDFINHEPKPFMPMSEVIMKL